MNSKYTVIPSSLCACVCWHGGGGGHEGSPLGTPFSPGAHTGLAAGRRPSSSALKTEPGSRAYHAAKSPGSV